MGFEELYRLVRGKNEFALVKEELATLYDKSVAQDNGGGTQSSASLSTHMPIQAGYESFLSARSKIISKGDLISYLEGHCEPPNIALDLLLAGVLGIQ